MIAPAWLVRELDRRVRVKCLVAELACLKGHNFAWCALWVARFASLHGPGSVEWYLERFREAVLRGEL